MFYTFIKIKKGLTTKFKIIKKIIFKFYKTLKKILTQFLKYKLLYNIYFKKEDYILHYNYKDKLIFF